ncbi:MAG: glycoside hydrolase family 13 [Ilumatobacteraceae bacterium]|nr:glycoside hydrolase family 13 [Ilumatobacteraceae bacterium]
MPTLKKSKSNVQDSQPTSPVPPASMVSADTANGESQALASDQAISRTFRAEAHEKVEQIALVGDFNDWSPTSSMMQRVDDHFEITIPLDVGRRYRYKFLVDGHKWENDWQADDYVPNEHGGDDSVVDLTERRR